jgi:uncharacterized membrane protein (UPF0127 family)
MKIDRVYFLTLLLIFVSLFFWLAIFRNQGPQLTVAGATYELRIADEDPEKEKGLGGLERLPKDEGMLFVFDRSDYYIFWMKDMNFPLDILWIDDDYKIIYAERNISPDSYPQKFVSQVPAKYVLEINGGQMYENGIQVGSKVEISGL